MRKVLIPVAAVLAAVRENMAPTRKAREAIIDALAGDGARVTL